MYHEDEDLHMCIYCHTTIVGLENYISHRNSSPCKSQHPVKASEAPIPVLPPLDLPKAERIRPVPSATSSSNGEHLNFLNAGFFFSSLELQSRRKDAVFEEVMGIEEVLEEEYDERENGGQRTVYSSGGKWGYEDYASEREIWPSEVERGGKGEVGMDREGEERQAEMEHQGGSYRVEDIDLETKTETCKEKDKQSGEKSKVNICETEENNHSFDENLDTGINYAIRDDSPTKPNDDMLRPSVMEMAPPVEAVDICMSGTGKESGISEFDISLDNCNLVIDSLNNKEDERRYKSSSSVPPSGHTRGKWVPGLASQGIRKSGNAVEYYCQPCNKNIRNRRSYEAHLSTSCHLKKLMRNTDGGVCASTSEGRRLRSRRLQLSKMNSTSDSLIGNSLPHEKTENGHASSCSDSQNYLMESLGIKRKVSKTEDNLDIKTHNSKITKVSSEVESKGQLPCGIEEQIDDVFAARSDSRKRRNLKSKSKVSNKSCKNSVGKISDTLDAQHIYGHGDGSAVNVNSTVSKCSLPTVHSVKMSGKSSLRNLSDHKDSLTDVINSEVVSLEKETENTSGTDIKSFKYPLVNLGYRCDSVKFQQEQEKMKANVDSEKVTYNSALQSSDKNLQDEMMLGLELIRTDHYLSSDGKSKKYELKTSELNQYDNSKQEVSDETKPFDNNNSSFPSTETTEVGVNCKKATDCRASYFGEEVINKVGVGPCESVEDFGCDMQREEIVVDSSRMEHDLTSNSETCYHAESKKINVRESNSTSHEAIVNNLSKTATVATQTVTAPSFELENSIKAVEHVKESLTLTPNDLDLTLSNTSFKLPADKTSSLQIHSKRQQYFTLKRMGSKVIFVKKLNQRDFPSLEGRSSLKKNQILIPKFSETESPSVQNHSKRSVKTIASNIENKADKILENAYLLSIPSKTSYKVNNEDPLSSENPKKELLPVKPFSATLIKIVKPSFEAKLDKIDINSAIKAGSELRPEVVNILDECESSVEKRNKINRETVKKEAEIRHKGNVSEDVVPCVKRMAGSTSKDSIHKSKQTHVFEVKGSERANLAQDLRKNGENGKHITNHPILRTISKQNKLNEAGDKCCEDKKNASQTLNIVINVDSKYCKLANNVTADLMNGNHLLSQAPKNPIIPKPKTAIMDRKFPDKGLFSAEISNPLPSTNAETSDENCASQRFMRLNEDNLFSNEQNLAKSPEANKLGAGRNLSENENVMEFQNKTQREEASAHPLVIWNKKPASETNNVKTVGAKPSKFMLIAKILDKINKTPEKAFDEKEKVLEEKRESNSTSDKASLVDPSEQTGDEIQEIDLPGKPAEKEGGVCSGGGSKPVLYLCGLCGYKSTRHWCVERHIVKHLPRLRRYACQLCNLAFLSLENLKQHMKRHETKKWGCDFQGCQQFFATKQELLVHLSGLHMTEKTYKCPLCEYLGKNSQALERHKKIHADVETLVECKVCTKSCKKENLERHMKMHENVEPYTCPFCDFKSSYLTNIRRHVRQSLIHSGKKLYNCPFCLTKNGKDEEIEHLEEPVTNQFSSDGAHDMLNHINAEHSEEKDLSYKLHCTSKLIRKLQMLLGIYCPTISSINNEGGSTKETKSIEEKEKDNSLEQDCGADGGSRNKTMSNEDIEMIDADQNVDNSFLVKHGIIRECSSDDVIISCNGNTSVARDSEAIKSKNTLARDQSCSLMTGILLDAESASFAVSTCLNNKNSCKTRREGHNLDTDIQSKHFDTILDMTDFMKKEVASKPDHRNEFFILNSDTPSLLPPAITKEHNLTDEDGSTSTTLEELPALDRALVSESEADDASNSEKGAKICCISNVFTMAEGKLTLNTVGGKNRFVNDNIIDSDNTLTDIASNVLAGEDTVSSDDCVIIENDVEVEDIKLENDFDTSEGNEELQNPRDSIQQSLILPENSSDIRMQSSDPGGFICSYESNREEDVSSRNKIRESQDAVKLTSVRLSKHKRKKSPRWTSEVEVIRKSDGVISLWPASPQLHKHT